MAVVYPDDIKAARMNAVKSALGVDGKLEIGTTGMATLIATIPLGSGGTVSAGVRAGLFRRRLLTLSRTPPEGQMKPASAVP